jgi:hypothetical protein
MPETTSELELRLNNTLMSTAQLGKIVLSKMYPPCNDEIMVAYLVCPQ